jgi:hypothetical protein
MMGVESVIQIVSKNPLLLNAIKKALEPDNSGAPKEIEIKTEEKEDKLVINVVDKEGNLLRLRNTVDDLCEAIETALNVLTDATDLKID